MVELPWADEMEPEELEALRRAREENDPWDIYDVLAYYLDIISPGEMIYDGTNDIFLDFPSFWLRHVFWENWRDGNPGWDREIKAALISSIIHSPKYKPENRYFDRWRQIVDRLKKSKPRVSDEQIDSYFRAHPKFLLDSLV